MDRPSEAGLVRRVARRLRPFGDSAAYWERRYRGGGTSGAGSYGAAAEAKARVVNELLSRKTVSSVVEFGCGDGNQLTLLEARRYLGLDVSATAVEMCIQQFADDESKSFFWYDPSRFSDHGRFVTADLALSQEVVFHLVEDDVFERYMRQLFGAARRFVLICSSDRDEAITAHLRHRRVTSWVARNIPQWTLTERISNPLPLDPATGEGLDADFLLYEPKPSPG